MLRLFWTFLWTFLRFSFAENYGQMYQLPSFFLRRIVAIIWKWYSYGSMNFFWSDCNDRTYSNDCTNHVETSLSKPHSWSSSDRFYAVMIAHKVTEARWPYLISALDARLSPGRNNYVVFFVQDTWLLRCFSPPVQVYKRVPANLLLGLTLRWKQWLQKPG